MHRYIFLSLASRSKKGLSNQSSRWYGLQQWIHDSAALAHPSSHGPGAQSSGTPVLNKPLKKQPNRDDALPSKGDQPVKDDPASQGSVADSSTAGSSPKLDPSSSGTKITNTTPSKGFHTLRSSAWSQQTRSSSLHTSSLSAQAKGDFALADIQDSSRDTAAAAEAKNAARGVASGSTRKDASATGRPSESAPTASESVPSNVEDKGLHGNVKDAQGNLQATKNQQVGQEASK